MAPLQHPTRQPAGWWQRLNPRSLTLKLTAAFLGVGLLGALLVAVFVGQRTQRALEQFLNERAQPTLMADLVEYYRANRSWAGVEQVFENTGGSQIGGRNGPPAPVLVAPDGQVIVGSSRHPVGSRVVLDERARAMPVIVDNTVVGWLLDGFGGPRPGPGSPEGDFRQRVTRAITYSAIGATAAALLLGFVLAQTLTRPLRELTAATQVVAKGALGQQVTVRSRDELGVLANSFNQMSTDLAQASTLRRQMTADIAHDLRTPLSVILGYTEALREGKLPPEQDIFDTLHTEAQHLRHLIDDLRTLSLADAGELTLARQPVAPQALIERAAAAYKAQAKEREINLVVVTGANLPEVEVDPERMAQVLSNLLSNALRYTPVGGTITVAADALDRSVQLRVQDTGAGIAPDALPHVFERFYRGDVSRQQGNGSSGLGLAIAKGIVEAHRGTITVESTVGQGTTFTITVPAAPSVQTSQRTGRSA